MVKPNDSFLKSETAAEALRARGIDPPSLGLILGSGLGSYAEGFTEAMSIPYHDIPHFPVSTVEGHAGSLVFGKVHGIPAVAMQGRVHAYEGHSAEMVAFPVHVLWQLGVRTLIVTNAAGGVNESWKPGDLVAIHDHLNLTGDNPLIGPNEKQFGPRFPDMSRLWSRELRDIAHRVAKKASIDLKEGVYAGVLGPNYETPAEVRMLRAMGADMVGMSTVFEAIVAGHLGMKLLGISCVTNLAAGVGDSVLNHDDVQAVAARVRTEFATLVDEVIAAIGESL